MALVKTIAESFKEQTATDTSNGVHEGGFSGLRSAFFPSHS